MKIRTLIVGYVLALALFLFAQRHPGGSSPTEFRAVVDLTHAVDAHSLASETTGKSLLSPQLFGTRIDAPSHFARGLWTVDQIPTERLIAPLVVLDVTEREPLPPESPLWKLDNLLLTPHVSAVSENLWDRQTTLLIENLERWFSGRQLLNRVDLSRGY